jgi:hypothetical protein
MESYPRYNEKGEENKFSPETGERLITTCNNHEYRTATSPPTGPYDYAKEPCGRAIESATQRHCMSCGISLLPFDDYFLPVIEKRDFWYNLESNESEQDRIQQLLDDKRNRRYEIENLPGAEAASTELAKAIWPYPDEPISEFPHHDDFIRGVTSDSTIVREWWEKYLYTKRILSGLLKELKRYNMQIISGEVKPPPIVKEEDNDKGNKDEDLPF